MKFSWCKKIISLNAFLLCLGCLYSDIMSKEEMENLIAQHLKPESSNQEIIAFLDAQSWAYGFDRYMNRYQVRDPKEDRLPEYLGRSYIYIYVDSEKNFIRAEVDKIFTFI